MKRGVLILFLLLIPVVSSTLDIIGNSGSSVIHLIPPPFTPLDDSINIKYQNISNIPVCAGDSHLTFDGTTLSCDTDDGGSGSDTQKTTNGFYLYNNTNTIFFNETQNNDTIDHRISLNPEGFLTSYTETDPVFVGQNSTIWEYILRENITFYNVTVNNELVTNEFNDLASGLISGITSNYVDTRNLKPRVNESYDIGAPAQRFYRDLYLSGSIHGKPKFSQGLTSVSWDNVTLLTTQILDWYNYTDHKYYYNQTESKYYYNQTDTKYYYNMTVGTIDIHDQDLNSTNNVTFYQANITRVCYDDSCNNYENSTGRYWDSGTRYIISNGSGIIIRG